MEKKKITENTAVINFTEEPRILAFKTHPDITGASLFIRNAFIAFFQAIGVAVTVIGILALVRNYISEIYKEQCITVPLEARERLATDMAKLCGDYKLESLVDGDLLKDLKKHNAEDLLKRTNNRLKHLHTETSKYGLKFVSRSRYEVVRMPKLKKLVSG